VGLAIRELRPAGLHPVMSVSPCGLGYPGTAPCGLAFGYERFALRALHEFFRKLNSVGLYGRIINWLNFKP